MTEQLPQPETGPGPVRARLIGGAALRAALVELAPPGERRPTLARAVGATVLAAVGVERLS